jgi:RNA-directed DNA polymerase
VNTSARRPKLEEAKAKVLAMQTKLHHWAVNDETRCFDDLFNLACDPAFLIVAWDQVSHNKGACTPGVDGRSPRSIDNVDVFLDELRDDLKTRRFTPKPVQQKMIPKANGKLRKLGIPTVEDRVVQASLKLVIEPIFEADFKPCSYGFRPMRRAQDAIAEIHYFGSGVRNYEHVLEGDIEACFDNIDHAALMGRIRRRVGDKRILLLIKAFLRAGILDEKGLDRKTITGTPQGGVLSPLLANIALSVLDEHFTRKWEALGPYWTRAKRRREGTPICRLIRYADDFVVMVAGTHEDAKALRNEIATVLAAVGLSLSEAKTKVCNLDEGFDFLGWRIQRRRQRGRGGKRQVYTYPSKKSLISVMGKVRFHTRRKRNRTLATLLQSLNRTLRGWCNYFRHGVSSRTFGYIDHFSWWRIVGWLRKRHQKLNWGTLRRRFLPGWVSTPVENCAKNAG